MKLLSAIVLILWTACFLHCSAEQFGVVDCAECPSSCSDEEREPCPDSEDSPCGLCDFLTIGGVPTATAFVLEGMSDQGVDLDATGFLAEMWQCRLDADPYGDQMGAKAREVSPCAPLYPAIAGKVLPVRGPNS